MGPRHPVGDEPLGVVDTIADPSDSSPKPSMGRSGAKACSTCSV